MSADGDGDRPLLVDNGKVVRGDVLGIIASALAESVSLPLVVIALEEATYEEG